MKVALIICTYNRNEYWQHCLDSLLMADLNGIDVHIVDDFSNDIDFSRVPEHWNIWRKKDRNGIKSSLLFGITKAFSEGAELIINLDGDAIVNNLFVSRLVELHNRFPDLIVSGFHSRNTNRFGKLRNPIIIDDWNFCMRKHANGINMCFNEQVFHKIVEPALLSDTDNWDYACTMDNQGVAVTIPSVVQHIGMRSSMGHQGSPDVSWDFKPLSLPNVTLLGIDRYNPKGLINARNISTKNISFGSEVIITDHNYWSESDGREGYSEWCIMEMYKFVDTDFVLIIHGDGYVQNYKAWKNEFLEYDYIGATWGYPHNNVGNGGFSLRSKKLLNSISQLGSQIDNFHPEDDIICRHMHPDLENEFGIKFAPNEIANQFSTEGWFAPGNTKKYNGEFGFHGYGVSHLPFPIKK